MGNLVSIFTELKLKRKVHLWLANKFDGVRVFTSGLDSGSLGAGVLIVMNSSLARHVFKVSEVPGWLLSIKLLFKNKLLVSAGDINFLIAKTVNESSFVVLGGNFNEDGVRKSASFKKCFDLGLVNALGGSVLTIDYMFVSSSLVNAVVDHGVTGIEDFFDTDHKAVSVSVGLGGLLDSQLNLIHKQANKDCWKFNFRNADLDAMWDIVHKVMVLSAVGTFKKKWFKGHDEVFTKSSSRFHKLELLVSKLVKVFHLLSSVEFASFFDRIRLALAKARKSYCSTKLLEFKRAEESHIRVAIDRKIESFESDKGHTIRSVLEHPFRKVVLDHLVVSDELILEPSSVKARVDGIIEDWTRKRKVSIPSAWKEAWVSMISKPYEWEEVFMNTRSIVLIETAHKILSKILSDRISLACSTFDVLRGNNFSVLKGMTTQSLIFAIGSVIENALEKNRELWLVLQDM
ncbi:hypothetical protein G9A89_001516 [Geosiphon pyriformis]|nr:hypothetical protein G9A89_001516 [Geosiphon pyriformis]